MYLKRLELSGFKSFSKKTTLTFQSPITAIVGPNGSGKSNIVEAIRFALGEQKIKSLRGKSGADLIFQGSKTLASSSRASVSVIFDNKERIFSVKGGPDSGGKLKIDFDEVVISREVYKDGTNKYKINGSEVRLKDILEITAGVNIGSSGHHIISQGQADRILNASPRERREMVEDALGLRIYKYRLRESERKLERTQKNLREVELLRREIAPHLKFLSRQVEKIKKTEEMRHELEKLYKEYLSREKMFLETREKTINKRKREFQDKLDNIESKLKEYGKESLDETQDREEGEKSSIEREMEETEKKREELRTLKDDMSRKLGKVEGMIEVHESTKTQKHKNTKTQKTILLEEVEDFSNRIKNLVDEALDKNEIKEVVFILKRIEKLTGDFLESHLKAESAEEAGEEEKALAEMKKNKDALFEELNKLEDEEKKLQEEYYALKRKLEEEKKEEKEKNRLYYEFSLEKNNLTSEFNILGLKEEELSHAKNDYEIELEEAKVLIGITLSQTDADLPRQETEQTQTHTEGIKEEPRNVQEGRRKKIERLKIRLEDAGGAGGGEVLKEYEETRERDQFLVRETGDLNKSIELLENLMEELQEKIDVQFKAGIEKINKEFQRFFELMFGGGSASLSLIRKPMRAGRGPDAEENTEEEEDLPEDALAEEGIDINVSLPRKKAEDLHVLSGGERSLTSIALLFAMTQVNPPPFLVLDETDAALDEANSRRYGDLLEQLSQHSQLILVTHNREIMSRAHVLYGVTMDASAASKLLSVKLDEAVEISK